MAADPQDNKPQTAHEEPKLSRDDLAERARSEFDVDPHTMAGALSLAPDNRQNFTKNNVAELLKKFKQNKVAPDSNKADAR